MWYSQHKLSTYLLQTNEIANKIKNNNDSLYMEGNVRNQWCLKYLCKIINPNFWSGGIVTFEIFSDIILAKLMV